MDKHFTKIAIGVLALTCAIFLGLSYQSYQEIKKANENLGVASFVKTDTGSTTLLKLQNLVTAFNSLEATTSMAQLNAGTATALASNPTDCSANQFANTIAANGNLTCSALVDADIPDTITASNYLSLATWYSTSTQYALDTDLASYLSLSSWFATTSHSAFASSTHSHPENALDTDLASYLSLSSWFGTTTDILDEGSNNLYWTNNRFDARLGASTSLPQLATAANLTDIGTITKLDYTQASGTNETLSGALWLTALGIPAGSVLAVDAAGKVIATTTGTGTGSGSGTVNSGTAGQVAYYAADGTALTGTSSFYIDSTGKVTQTYASGTAATFQNIYGNLTGDVTGTASGNLTSASIDTIAELNAIMGGEDVASTTWAGASSLITLGTVTTGTWNATPLTAIYGGTGLTAGGLKAGSIPYGAGASAFATSSALQFSGSTLTVTYASSTGITATNFYGNWAGDTIEVTKGGTGLTAIAAGGLLYGSAANTLSVLASSTAGKVLKIGSTGFPEWGDDSFVAAGNYTPTGTWDMGGATSLEIPNGASPTVNAAGEIALDTTSDQLKYYGGAENVLLGTFDKSYYIGSTTIDKSSINFINGTTTHELWNPRLAVTLTNLYCKTDTGTLELVCGDGTNKTEIIVCDNDGQADDGSITNGTFTAREDFICDIGTDASSPNKVTVTATFKWTAD